MSVIEPTILLDEIGQGVGPERTARPAYRLAGVVTAGAVTALILGHPVVGTSLFLAGVVICVAAFLHARSRPGDLIVVGREGADTFLDGVIRSGVAFQSDAGQHVHRVDSINDAVSLARTIRCDEIVGRNIDEDYHRAKDRDGRNVRLSTHLAFIERYMGRTPLEALQTSLVDPRRRWVSRWATGRTKRVVDTSIALVLLMLLLPLALLIASALWISGSAQVVQRLPILGRGDRRFDMITFYSDPAARLGSRRSARTVGHSVQRIVADLHFDLIPSLLNVINGDMALVGPRPAAAVARRSDEVETASRIARASVRPALVSMAQTRFRYTNTPRDLRLAAEYDLFYARRASFLSDTGTLFRAIAIVTGDVFTTTYRILRSQLLRLQRAVLTPTADALGIRSRRTITIAMPRTVVDEHRGIQPTLIVGAGAAGKLLARQLQTNPGWGFWPIGFVDDDLAKVGHAVDGLPVLGASAAIPAIVRREHVEAVIVAIPSAPEVITRRIFDIARETPARVLSMPNLGEALHGGAKSITISKVEVTDVLGRPVVRPDVDMCRQFIAGKRVLVTGAAGSIGRELARQVAQLSPAVLVGLDINESDLFDVEQEVAKLPGASPFVPVVASVTNAKRLERVFRDHRPDVVFHAAAYKHVPMMEQHPFEAVMVNAVGTHTLADVAAKHGVSRFVLVSTDKAVRPSNVMGGTKRLAELAVRSVGQESGMSACAVRFGNVLGSRGSVIPIFEKQIAAGGPVTVTDPRMMRYFMTIPEAVGLIIQAGALGERNVTYMLDMGEEVSIAELAKRMIRLHGLRVGEDIEVVYSGLRPGEKLREDLALEFESASPTAHAKIRVLNDVDHLAVGLATMRAVLGHLARVADDEDMATVRREVLKAVHRFDGTMTDRVVEIVPQSPEHAATVAAS